MVDEQYPNLRKRARAFKKEKALGQNFLIDEGILDKSVASAKLNSDKDIVVEYGAGIGFLTERLVKNVKHLYSIELDKDTEFHLKMLEAANANFTYKIGDILQTDLADVVEEIKSKVDGLPENQKVKIVANIPYQISSKIILHLLGDMDAKSKNQELVSDIYILVQKEFAERLTAKPGIKAYGAITLLVQYWAEVEYLFDVPSACFDPAPKVNSAFIRITPRGKAAVEGANPKSLRRLIKAIFANRRKKLSNGLKAAGYDKGLIDSLDLGNLRGETMTIQEISDLADKLAI